KLRFIQHLGRNDGIHRSFVADMAYKRPCVDIGNTHEVVVFKILLDGLVGLFTAVVYAIALADQTCNLDPARLRLLISDAVIADMGIGGYHDLTIIGRIGKNLLVTGGAGIETDFASGGSDLSGGFA